MAYTVDTPEGVNRFGVLSLRGQLKLVKAGMSPPRGVRKGDLVRMAQRVTGKKFGQRDYEAAIAALDDWLKENE
jgi:hypothetical protein